MYQLYFKFINKTFLLETNSLIIFNILKMELWPSESNNYVQKLRIIYVGSGFAIDNVYDNYVAMTDIQHIVGYDKKEHCECLFVTQASTIQPVRNFIAAMVCSNYKEDKNFLVLHASCITKKNHGILILGKKHSGKTTLSLEMIANYNYHLVTDDLSFLVLRGSSVYCYSLFKGLHLNNETFDYFNGFSSDIYNVDSPKTRYYVKNVMNRSRVSYLILSEVDGSAAMPTLSKDSLEKGIDIICDNYVNFTSDVRSVITAKTQALMQKKIRLSACCFGKDIESSGMYLNNILISSDDG